MIPWILLAAAYAWAAASIGLIIAPQVFEHAEKTETIRRWIARLPRAAEIAHGGATGADAIAGEVAEALGHKVRVYPANWKLGRAAGPIRNRAMLQDARPARVLAFPSPGHPSGAISRGTLDCIMAAVQLGVPVTICPPGSRP